jgi:primosomal protein N''
LAGRLFLTNCAKVDAVEKKQKHSTQFARMQEIIRANEQRLARSRAAIGSVEAHLQQVDRPVEKGRK